MKFKGYKQVKGYLSDFSLDSLENGYIYFVRTSEDNEDGFIYLNGKKYGTANSKKLEAGNSVSESNLILTKEEDGWRDDETIRRNNGCYITDKTIFAENGFYETSDERKKTFLEDIPVDFELLKAIPKKYFLWKDSENHEFQIGTSAQVIRDIYPEIVNDSPNGLSVAYDKLAIISLAAIDKLKAENEELKVRIEKIEKNITD